MQKSTMNLDESLESLAGWTDALAKTVKSTTPEVRETFEEGKVLPEGCPSPASMAEISFRQVKKRLHEVEAAVERVEQAIWNQDQ